MPAEYAGPTVVVVGPPDLVITSLVTALRAKGMRAERGRTSDPRALHAHLTHGPAGILLVDLDPHRATNLIAGAAHLGWTVLAVGGGASRSRVAAAVAAGAAGWLPKTTPLRDLVRAVQDVAAGHPVMDEEQREQWLAVDREARAAAQEREAKLAQLTQREREVLERLAAGRKAAEVAEDFTVSIATVRTQIRAILHKLGVNAQEAAVALYRQDEPGT